MRKWIVSLACLGALVLAGFLLVPHAIPALLSRHRPDIRFVMPTDEKRIFITIDDAPSAGTARILEVLRKHDVPAAFFVMADRVTSPAQLQEIVEAGHLLGNHLRTARPCSELSLEEFESDLATCTALLDRVQPSPSRWFRPPSDFGTKEQITFAADKGYQTVMGSVFPLDHWISNSRVLASLARWLSLNGGIVILHDGEIRGRTTAEVLDRLIPELRKAGFSFGRLDELQGLPQLTTDGSMTRLRLVSGIL